MKNHFKVEAWVMLLLATLGVVVAFIAAWIVRHLTSWH
jgi:predicted Co/Zn/Cd cation transporter (cation efflux family)